MVFYRKYRPQHLEELVGQEVVKNTLQKSFENGKLAHAYLFCGPRGTGKTSTARILAKMVNCQSSVFSNQLSDESQPVIGRSVSETDKQKTDPDSIGADKPNSDIRQLKTENRTIPCNNCSSCLSITDGSSLDVIEIDAASNRGIDDIRALRDKVKLSPTSSAKKVYIIDEVHMLTTEAFNALLKTLEEPPSHVLFVLATTEFQKIPQTILSRVQKLDFQLAKPSDLLIALKKVAKGEEIKITDDALSLVAKRSEGSFRDALKILDQIASSNSDIDLPMVENSIKSGNFEQIVQLLQSIEKKDAKSALEILSLHLSSGINIKEYILSLIDSLRLMMLIKLQASDVVKQTLSPGKYQSFDKLQTNFSLEQLLKVIDNLHLALEKMRYTSIPSLPLEVALVESCQLSVVSNQLPDESQPVIGQSVKTDQQTTDKLNSDNRQQKTDNEIIMKSDVTINKSSIEITQNVESLVSASVVQDINVPTSGDILTLQDKWNYILETVKPFNFSLEALLKSVKLLSFEDGKVILEVPYTFHQRILETPRNRDMLESVFSDVLQKSVHIGCVLGKRPVRIEEIANVELAQDDEVIRLASEIFNSDSAS